MNSILIHCMLLAAIVWRVGMIKQMRDYCWYGFEADTPRYIIFCYNMEIIAVIFGIFTFQWWMYLAYGASLYITWRIHGRTRMQNARAVALTDLTLTIISIITITWVWLKRDYGVL